jgi:hypothetical protein
MREQTSLKNRRTSGSLFNLQPGQDTSSPCTAAETDIMAIINNVTNNSVNILD